MARDIVPICMRRLLPTLVLVAALGCGVLEPAAATVDGHRIPQSAVEAEIARVRDDRNFRQLIERQGPSVRGDARRNTLSNLIRVEFIVLQAKRRGVTVDDSLVDTYLRDLKRQLGGEAQFRRVLAQSNLTLERARVLAERQLYARELRKKVTAGLKVDETKVVELYAKNTSSFVQVELAKASGKTAQAARDAASAGSLTDLGWVDENALDSSISSLVEPAAVGSVTAPLKTRSGYDVYKVKDRRTKSLQEARESIMEQLLGAQREEAFTAWLEKRMRNSRIVVNPRYGRFDASTLSVVAVS